MSEDEQDRRDVAEWVREEALNFEKMLSGERRLDFVEWKQRRDERARTVHGGAA
jgi:hypothetical protein